MLKIWILILLTLTSPALVLASTNPSYFEYEYHTCSTKQRKEKPFKHIQKEEFSFDPLTEEEKLTIADFIQNLSLKSREQLLEDKNEIEKKFIHFRKVYPMITTQFILSDPFLHQKVREILQEEKKLVPFLLALSISIHKAKENGMMQQYISEFADFLNLEKNTIQFYIDHEKYKELVSYIFQI